MPKFRGNQGTTWRDNLGVIFMKLWVNSYYSLGKSSHQVIFSVQILFHKQDFSSLDFHPEMVSDHPLHNLCVLLQRSYFHALSRPIWGNFSVLHIMFQSLDQVLPCLISALDLGSCGFTVAYVMSQADLLVSRTFQTMQDLEHIFVRCMFFHYPYQFN